MKNFIKKFTELNFTTTSWSGGKTTQLFIYPKYSNYQDLNFKVRISSASVELEKSNFTILNGVTRFITPLTNSLQLTHDNNIFTKLNPFRIYEFDGNRNTISYGKAIDFNLMLANGARGALYNFYISENNESVILTKPNLNVLYSYDNTFSICINEEIFMLNPNEILVIQSDIIKRIKIRSNSNANILLSHIE